MMISSFAVGLFNVQLASKIKRRNCLTIEIMAIFISKLSYIAGDLIRIHLIINILMYFYRGGIV
ncbi:hypothetical protein B9T24_04010 [Acinetobacter sp. ANC 4654]|nr:hypothetical protein B9T24_04010 [Acinetobacter sp. ANC 4654]